MGYFEVNKMPLHVLRDDGFDTTHSGSNIKETTLLYENIDNNVPTYYFNSGFDGIEFEISVLIKPTYFFKDEQVSSHLNTWDKWGTVVSVVTSALDIPNGKYTMQIKNKKQTSFNYSVWKLRFKQYYEDSVSFETLFNQKTNSLSSKDQILLAYWEINQYSPKSAILALQQKLQDKGCFCNSVKEFHNGYWEYVFEGNDTKKRTPNGVWDIQMQEDIYDFQHRAGLDETKQGKCDRETIVALCGEYL